MKSVFRFSLALSVCLLLIAPVAFAQTTGEIQGTVMGTDGRPLPGVTVEATSPSLQGTRVSVTGNDGNFRFISLPPGSYKIKGSLSGFTTVEISRMASCIGLPWVIPQIAFGWAIIGAPWRWRTVSMAARPGATILGPPEKPANRCGSMNPVRILKSWSRKSESTQIGPPDVVSPR